MADLNQFLNKDLTADDVTHSSGYAQVGGAGAGGLSMEKRAELRNKEVRVVGDYRWSKLGRQGSATKAKTADQTQGSAYDASSDTFSDGASHNNRQKADIKDQAQVDTKSIERREHFIEPPSRGYDKYA